MRKWALLVVVFFVALVVVEFKTKSLLAQRLIVGEAKFISVKPGESASVFVDRMIAKGVLQPSPLYRVLYKRYPLLMKIKTGTYQIQAGESFRQLLLKITQGKGHLFRITLIEGETLAQFALKLRRHDRLSHHYADDNIPYQVAQQLNMDNAEGWLFPDTYYFEAGTSDRTIVNMAYDKMRNQLSELWPENQNETINSPYETLILASIIEKETALSSERNLIASVFANRLRDNMRLQTDPTIIYGLGASFNGDLTRKDMRTDTPYNTYTRKGLPPTPIAMPGLASIKAALNPEDSSYYFFVASGDGGHVFSENYKDHLEALRQYQLKQ